MIELNAFKKLLDENGDRLPFLTLDDRTCVCCNGSYPPELVQMSVKTIFRFDELFATKNRIF